MLEIGSVVDGKYKILNQIGQGGMSTVYLAVNERVNKPWAIKEVRKDGAAGSDVVRQSQIMETNLLKKLRHPHLPGIVDVIDQTDSFLIVMDYIEGKPLSYALQEKKRFSCEEVMEWARQICDVLAYLHTRRPPIIYRDMKPANIMLKPDGSVMLIDFGIAREFKEQNVKDTVYLGTQGYAAPEQFGGQGQTDARTDIYCLGATMYHLITGHDPSEPPYEMYPIRYWDVTFSSGLEQILLKCTQKNPQDRYQSCGELLYALEHYEEADEAYQRLQNRKWYLFVMVFFLFLAASVGAGISYAGMKRETLGTYEKYLNTASMTPDIEEKYQYYEKAIQLAPEKGDAYKAMLETIRADGVFSEKESREIRRILPAYMDRLAGNRESYVDIAYELGILYFYYYEKSEDIQNAEKWMRIAAGDEEETGQDVERILGKQKAFRARHLYQILQIYRSLGTVNREGDAVGSYAILWEELSAIMTPELAREDNPVTALVLYNFMANQIALHAQDYMDSGINKEEMEQMLSNLQDWAACDKANSYEETLYTALQENLRQAGRMVSVVLEMKKKE